jgi:transcriptional regulator with XRE-family HTH domain
VSRNELPVDGDWAAVHTAVRRRMLALGLSTAGLSRESGVSETTIRYLRRPEKRQRSTLVALAAALGCQHDYLVSVLAGAAESGDPDAGPPPGLDARSPETAAVQVLPVQAMLDGLAVTLQVVDGRMEMIFRRQE